MFDQDLEQFALLIAGIGETYGKQFTSAAIEIYWRVLEPYRLEDVRAAIYCHISNPDVGKFFPRPADIITAIEGSSYNQSLSAWSKTVYAMRVVGGYESIAFDDALIHAVVWHMRSWPKLCFIDDKQLPFIEKEFQERYRGYVIHKPDSYPSHLKGLIEIHNNAYGYVSPPPVMIGNAAKVKQVIATGKSMPLIEISVEKISLKNLARAYLNKNHEKQEITK